MTSLSTNQHFSYIPINTDKDFYNNQNTNFKSKETIDEAAPNNLLNKDCY